MYLSAPILISLNVPSVNYMPYVPKCVNLFMSLICFLVWLFFLYPLKITGITCNKKCLIVSFLLLLFPVAFITVCFLLSRCCCWAKRGLRLRQAVYDSFFPRFPFLYLCLWNRNKVSLLLLLLLVFESESGGSRHNESHKRRHVALCPTEHGRIVKPGQLCAGRKAHDRKPCTQWYQQAMLSLAGTKIIRLIPSSKKRYPFSCEHVKSKPADGLVRLCVTWSDTENEAWGGPWVKLPTKTNNHSPTWLQMVVPKNSLYGGSAKYYKLLTPLKCQPGILHRTITMQWHTAWTTAGLFE